MTPAYSTALSDAVLALSAFYTSMSVYRISTFAAVGFLLMASAASLGVLRFSQAYPSDSLVGRHKYMSKLTASFGLPMIAVAFLRQPLLTCVVLTVAVSFFVFQQNLSPAVAAQVGEAIGASAMLIIIVQGFLCSNMCSIFGVGVFAFAALVIKTEGYFNSIPRVDLFHYALVLANVLLKEGLQFAQLPDVYYKP